MAPKNPPRQPTLLVIMDGVGLNPSRLNNAVAQAKTPSLDKLFSEHPTTVLEASGRAVGLPDGQMGNSEVGHLTLGCGSVLRQDLVKINDAVDDHSLEKNAVLQATLARTKQAKRPLHLVGLVSDGGIHSHINHLLALIEICARESVKPLVHMITDGRDTAPQCAERFVDTLAPALARADGQIISICGRYFAMDRDRRWDRVEKAWRLLTQGVGNKASSAQQGIAAAYALGETDEFIKPIVLPGFEPMQGGDQVLFFNFRNDRPRELAEALALDSFSEFDRGDFDIVEMTTLTRFDPDYPFAVLFEKEVPEVTLGEVVASQGIAQLRSAETEKYPHVTFFFSGGREEPFEYEERILVDSPKVETYDQKPEMSAFEICEQVNDALSLKKFGLVVVNFANGDMVGHTGVKEAVVAAIEVVDDVVGKMCQHALDCGYSIVLTADHGNADMLVDPVSGAPHTQHTTFPVACTVIDKNTWRLANGRGLPAIAPTILQLMGLPQPEAMSAQSLLLESLSA